MTSDSKPTDRGEELEAAIALADPYGGRGTSYLHAPPPSAGGKEALDKSGCAENPTGAVVTPISLATTFAQASPGVPSGRDDPNSFRLGYEYSRTGNPTRGSFERALARAERAEHCVAFASGSAAAAAVVSATVKAGEGILSVDDVYGGTQRYFRRIVAPGAGIEVEFCDFNDVDAMRKILDRKSGDGGESRGGGGAGINGDGKHRSKFKLLWLETPTNPTLKVSDIRACADLANSYGAILCVDNTFCSPHFQNPLSLGAHIVVHSVTKYIGGHSDVVMGAACTNDDSLRDALRFVQNGVGAVPSPFDCFLAHRGLKTLHLRMEASARNAMAIALFLKGHGAVMDVAYPGLRSHPGHDLAERQQMGFGSVISFHVRGGREASRTVLENLRIFALAESLGAVESLAECPSLMTHASVPEEKRKELGISDGLIRLSVGIESCRDLVEDLEGALNAVLGKVQAD